MQQSIRRSVRNSGRQMLQMATAQLPYRLGWRWLNWLYGQPSRQRSLHPQEYKTLARVVNEFEIAEDKVAEAQKHFMIGNFIFNLLSRGAQHAIEDEQLIRKASKARFFATWRSQVEKEGESASLLQILGWPYIQEAFQQGRGVILLTYHSTSLGLAQGEIARRLHIDHIDIISEFSAKALYTRQQNSSSPASLSLNSHLFKLTMRASQRLRQGHLLLIANDHGYAEVGTLPVVVGKRAYQIKPGFAELALATGATILPCYSWFEPNGRIQAVIQPPVAIPATVPPTGAAHRAVVNRMVESYGHLVEMGLRTRPASLTYGALLKYLRQPFCAP